MIGPRARTITAVRQYIASGCTYAVCLAGRPVGQADAVGGYIDDIEGMCQGIQDGLHQVVPPEDSALAIL